MKHPLPALEKDRQVGWLWRGRILRPGALPHTDCVPCLHTASLVEVEALTPLAERVQNSGTETSSDPTAAWGWAGLRVQTPVLSVTPCLGERTHACIGSQTQ